MKTFFTALLLTLSTLSHAQQSTDGNFLNLRVGARGKAQSNLALDVTSTTKGIRLPQMTTTQRNAIPSPSPGTLVDDITIGKVLRYNGSTAPIPWSDAIGLGATVVDTNGNINTGNNTIDTGRITVSGGVSALDANLSVGALNIAGQRAGSEPCPSQTQTNRDAISSPRTGLCVYNTTTQALNVYNGSSWVAVGTGSGAGSEDNFFSNGTFSSGLTGGVSASPSPSPSTALANVLFGTTSIFWDSTATAQVFTLQTVSVTSGGGLSGQAIVGSVWVKVPSGNATHQLRLFDGTNPIGTVVNISAGPVYSLNTVTGFVPSGFTGTISLQIVSVASNEPAIYADKASVKLGPDSIYLITSPVNNAKSWTPTGSWNTNTTYTGTKWQVGDRAFYEVTVTLTGAPNATGLSINMPSGEVIDDSKFPGASGAGRTLGDIQNLLDNGTDNFVRSFVRYNNSTSVAVYYQDNTTLNARSVSNVAPYTFATGDQIAVSWNVPIVGWTSSTSGVLQNTPSAPTVQKFTSGSGTYTKPDKVSYISVKMVGGGGGSAGSGNAGTAGAGGAGGNTTFGSSLLVANGGQGGTIAGGSYQGGAGGTASLGTITTGTAIQGAGGGGASGSSAGGVAGGYGGSSPFGGAGQSGAGVAAGTAAVANSGSGGGGGGSASTTVGGAGGGAGGYVEAIIPNPASTYSYSVGTSGAAGAIGTSGAAGTLGGSGYIEVTEYYGNNNITVPGVSNPGNSVKNVFGGAFGGANLSTACTSSPCGIFRGGEGVTSVTRSGTGNYVINITAGTCTAAPQCSFSGVNPGNFGVLCYTDVAPNTATTYTLQSVDPRTLTAANAVIDYQCSCPK